MQATELAKNAIIQVEETFDSLSRKYRDRFGYGDSIRVVPYTTYGLGDTVRVCGRVLADQKVDSDEEHHVARNLFNMLRRYQTEEVAGARLKISVGSTEAELVTDDEGYYDETIELDKALAPAELIAEYEIELLEPHSRNEQFQTTFTGQIEVPTNARFGVISDIDDTVVYTGAHDLFRHTRTVILNNAFTRVPFCGVAPFYRGLRDEQGTPTNPIFYVSSSPTNLYELFVDFMQATRIPTGPIMLKDFGFEPDKFLKTTHHGYKRERIESLFETFPMLSFILIGDSGQHDAEIYEAIVEDHPDRVLAVYIRDVCESEERDAEIDEIAARVCESGVPMKLMATTLHAAEHAAEQHWITPSELEEVRDHVENPELDRREPGMVGAQALS